MDFSFSSLPYDKATRNVCLGWEVLHELFMTINIHNWKSSTTGFLSILMLILGYTKPLLITEMLKTAVSLKRVYIFFK